MTDENPIQKAEKVLADLKAENDRREKLLADEQRLQSERILSGSAGGRVEPKAPEKISNIEYANKLMRGEVNPLKEDGIHL
jgi:hypothetical protein